MINAEREGHMTLGKEGRVTIYTNIGRNPMTNRVCGMELF